MADLGLTKAIAGAVRAGARGAKVLRPVEKEVLAKEAAAAAEKAAAEQAAARAGAAAPEAPAPAPAAPPASPIQQEAAGSVKAATDQGAIIGPRETMPGAPAADAVRSTSPESQVIDSTVRTSGNLPPAAAAEPRLVLPEAQVPVHVTAERLSTAELGNYALDEAHMPNFDRIETTDGIKATIADFAEQNKVKINEARREVITHEQLKGLAGDLGLGEDVIAPVLARESGGTLNAETILASRQVLVSSADRLKTLADKISAGGATDLEKVQFARQVQFHQEYQRQFMGARAEAGRALNAFAIPVGSDARQITELGQLLDKVGGDINRMADAIHLSTSTAGITKATQAGIFRRTGRAAQNLVNRVFVNGILSSPVTHMVNATGNLVYQGMRSAELGAAARMGRFLGSQDGVLVGEAMANLHGAWQATADAWRLASRSIRTGKTLDNVLKFDVGARRTTEILPELDKPFIGRLLNIVDHVIDAPTARGLSASDEAFKMMAYRADIERQVFREVHAQVLSGNMKLTDVEAATRNMMEHPTPAMEKASEDWAREATFQSPLGKFAGSLNAALRQVPVLTLVAPFVRTPVNLFKVAYERSPLGIFSTKFWDEVSKGGAARDMALTKYAIGTATSTMMVYEVAHGNITGAGPQDPAQRKLWEANGNQPYSFRAYDPTQGKHVWKSYARLEPFATVIGATADATEISAYLNADVETLQDPGTQSWHAAAAIIAGIMNNTGNKTFMKGLADFVDVLHDPQSQAKPYITGMTAAMMPYSGALKAVRNTQDPYLREAWSIIDKLRDETPGMSKDMPVARSLFGEPRLKNSSSLLGVMTPMPERDVKRDPIYTELQQLMSDTHLVPLVMPEKRVEGMLLNPKEYERLTLISRTQPIFDGGTVTLREKIADQMDTEVYKDATPMHKVELIKNLQHSADEIARQRLREEDPLYAERLAVYQAKRDRLRFGQ